MTKRLVIEPDGWPCELGACLPGLFVFNGNGYETIGFKSEYGTQEVFCVDSGEAFWGGTSIDDVRQRLIVQPCKAVWK